MYAESHRNRIKLYLPGFDPAAIQVLKNMPHATRRQASTRDTAHWTFPLSLSVALDLKERFGDRIEWEPSLRADLRKRSIEAQELQRLSTAVTAKLSRLPDVLPDLYRALYVGPRSKDMMIEEMEALMKEEVGSYQLADVAYGSKAAGFLNGNKPGLGKTLEYIGVIYEAGLETGRHLVVSPSGAIETVWLDELERWQDVPVWPAIGTATERNRVIDDFMMMDEPGFLLVNPEMVRMIEEIERCKVHKDRATKTQMRNCKDCVVVTYPPYKELFNVEWTTVVIDECHKNAMRNPRTLTAEGMNALRAGKRIAQSGTPMGGRTINLWGILHWLDPDEFTSKWRWADDWLDIDTTYAGHKNIGDLRSDREADFYRAHAPYILRRTKEEVLPWLPVKQHIDLWCEMSPKHAKQYKAWADDAEVRIDGQRLSATSILDEYVRLKQMAFSYCDVSIDNELMPTADSGKLVVLRQKLDELGLYDTHCDEQVVIFSQFTVIADFVAQWLVNDGIEASTITGRVTGNVRGMRDARGRKVSKRANLQRRFQAGDIRAMVMNTAAGGVAINLDRANTAVFLDETWVPDDQEQAEDRVQRGTTLHQVTCLYLRTRGTIEEDIKQSNFDKSVVNTVVLDQLRHRHRARA